MAEATTTTATKGTAAAHSNGHGCAAPAPGSHPTVGHVVPVRVLLAVAITLMVLTWMTLAATWVDLGRAGNLWIALIIATVKASLVALYFMHLRYDRPFNAIVLISSLVFVILFIGLALLDTSAYQGEIPWVEAPAMQRQTAAP